MDSPRWFCISRCALYYAAEATIIISAAVMFAGQASAAVLFFSPAEGTAEVGKTIMLDILVTSEEAINAISGMVAFPRDMLTPQTPAKEGSILDWWTAEPVIDNAKGTITFEGVAVKGFTGNRGKVLRVPLQVIQTGLATISFSSASVLANDGSGNNILKDTGRARFSLSAGKGENTAVVQKEVYKEERPAMNIPEELVISPSAFARSGLVIQEIIRTDHTIPYVSFIVSRGRGTGGVYEVYIDGEKKGLWQDDGSHVYTTPLMVGGTHAVVIKTKNTQGKILMGSAPFEISALQAPVIKTSGVPGKPAERVIAGKTRYPGALMRITFTDEKGTIRLYETFADAGGRFMVKIDPALPKGMHTVRSQVYDGRGARSGESNALMVFQNRGIALPFSWLVWLGALGGILTVAYGFFIRKKELVSIAPALNRLTAIPARAHEAPQQEEPPHLS